MPPVQFSGLPRAPQLIGLPAASMQGGGALIYLVTRIRITAADISYKVTGGNFFWCAAEARVFATPDGSGSPLAVTASVSSVRAGYPNRNATLLTDGAVDNLGTASWNSQENGTDPEWIQLDLTSPAVVLMVSLWFPAFDGDYFPRMITISRTSINGSVNSRNYNVDQIAGAWQNFIIF